MTQDTIPREILPYLNEISERLWTGHASVMIGAGFSKNAIAKDSNSKALPSWYELGDIFYQKIHGVKPHEASKYLNPLKLAEEVQAAFGRSVLNQLLMHNIADKDYEPSDLHVKMLELPWSDVFTTNYDTLLERSCENVLNRRFDVVVNQEDIIYSNRPRIIKLHGSFPSERPLIITEEDYRTYPKKFAPFVNTVQQSLLENTLCLVGFSGEDPNFLQWIGWINDNIGKENSPKIYLIGILGISEAQKKLLNSKNIVPVDLSYISDIKGNHKKAMDFFIDFLHGGRKTREKLEWPSKSITRFSFSGCTPADIIEEWRKAREAYPNWVVLPRDQRDKLWQATESSSNDTSVFETLEAGSDIDYIYELNWRMERCLLSFNNMVADHVARIIDRYNPFSARISEVREFNDSDEPSGLNWHQLRGKWASVALSLLRYYREEGLNEQWDRLHDVLVLAYTDFTSDQQAAFFYERILRASYSADKVKAVTLLKDWPSVASAPYWEAKRASLVSEFGQPQEAIKILEASLLTIRKRLNLSPVEDDYGWLSQEAYVMFLLDFINLQLRFSSTDKKRELGDRNFGERWSFLLQYKCDPWAEKNYFELVLKQSFGGIKFSFTKPSFDISRSIRSYTIGGNHKDGFIAFTFFRFLEEVGIPLSLKNVTIGTQTIEGALERIMLYVPSIALGVLERTTNAKLVNPIFSRQFIFNISSENTDKLIGFYLEKFDEFFPDHTSSPFSEAFTRKVPAILSRLVVKSGPETKRQLYLFAHKVYNSREEFPEFGAFVRNLIRVSPATLIGEVMHLLVDIPLVGHSLRDTWTDPFDDLKNIEGPSPSLPSKYIANVFDEADNSEYRESAVRRLVYLYKNRLLSTVQSNKMTRLIWGITDEENGFPAKTSYYKFFYITIPHPKKTDVHQMFKEYILKNTFDIQMLREDPRSVSMKRGRDDYAMELLHGSFSLNNNEGTKWNKEEVSLILDKCIAWWESDRHFIIEDKYKDERFGGSVHEEFMVRFRHLSNIIARVLGYQRATITDQGEINRIASLVRDMGERGVPVLKAKLLFAKELGFSSKGYLSGLQQTLSNEGTVSAIEALESVLYTFYHEIYHDEQGFEDNVLDIVLQPLVWRLYRLMPDCLDTIREIIKFRGYVPPFIRERLFGVLQHVRLGADNIEALGIDDSSYFFIRQKSIALSGQIYRQLSDKHDLPEEIEHWSLLANDPNEFGDVTIYWGKEEN